MHLRKQCHQLIKFRNSKDFYFLKKSILAVTVTIFNISSALPCQQLGDGFPDLSTASCRGWVLWRERGRKTKIWCHWSIKPFFELWLKVNVDEVLAFPSEITFPSLNFFFLWTGATQHIISCRCKILKYFLYEIAL